MNEKLKNLIDCISEKTKQDCYVIDIIDEKPGITDDKIGGIPYIPIGEDFPVDQNGNILALLLQVNCEHIDLEGWPKEGILEIFTDSELDYPSSCEIRLFKKDLPYRIDFPQIDFDYFIVTNKDGFKIKLTKDYCTMPIEDFRFDKIIEEISEDILGQKIYNIFGIQEAFPEEKDFYDAYIKNTKHHNITIGGYPGFTQEDPREYEEEFKDKLYCIFKLDSAEDFHKFDVGDAGIFCTFINFDQFKNCNFDDAQNTWDCC